MNWAILLVIVLGIVSTMIFLTLFLQAYKQAHECDTYKSIMCYIDWKCYMGTRDAFNNVVGALDGSDPQGNGVYDPTTNPNGQQGSLAMECYLRGLYGDTSNPDCTAFYAHRDTKACTTASLTGNHFCTSYDAGTSAGTYDAAAGNGGQNSQATSQNNPFGCMCFLGAGSNTGYALAPPNSGADQGMPVCTPGTTDCTADGANGTPVTGTTPGSTFCFQSAAFVANKAGQSFCAQPV